jgi:hypothetical protein
VSGGKGGWDEHRCRKSGSAAKVLQLKGFYSITRAITEVLG